MIAVVVVVMMMQIRIFVRFSFSDSYAKDRRCLRHFRLLVERESLVVIPVVIAKDVDENNSMMSEETEMGSMLKVRTMFNQSCCVVLISISRD